MHIGGIIRNSLLDYPGHPAVVIFTQGCNWNCPYCHNPHLIPPQRASVISGDSVIDLLLKRPPGARNLVITGGEPTLQPKLTTFLQSVKSRNVQVKLDTNGSNPAALRALLQAKLVDYVAMDVKGPLPTYANYCGKHISPEVILESIELLRSGTTPYEFRTTIVPALHQLKDVSALSKMIAGGRQLFLQPFRKSAAILRPKLALTPTPTREFMRKSTEIANEWLPTRIRD